MVHDVEMGRDLEVYRVQHREILAATAELEAFVGRRLEHALEVAGRSPG
jgi:hypothetical protein